MLSRERHYGLAYAYYAHFIFMEVSSGIYKVKKDRSGDSIGKYVTTDTVLEWLNSDRRVAIARNEIGYIIHTNFEMDTAPDDTNGTTNAEMRGLLEEEE